MGWKVRGGVHASGGEVVEVVVRQEDAADQHSDHSTHVQGLGDDVAEDAEEVGDGHLGDLVVDQEPEVAEQHRADQSCIADRVPQAAPIPREAETVSRNFHVISQAISPALDSAADLEMSTTMSPEWKQVYRPP